jgi:uncharacterized protein YyaL (SSP411 family)
MTMPNRLIQATSPYLLQHAHNPVDWFPWGEEALQKARAEDKPVFLSIGYAACHWCHVMAHESFQDPATAEFLNENFISIKVDREERPDIDSIYMDAVVAMTGQGGWPLSVFLTPDGAPFYGGTYFPNVRRYNLPAFTDILRAIAEAWKNQRDDLLKGSVRLTNALKQDDLLERFASEDEPTLAILNDAVNQIHDAYDAVNGGWGTAPKFPQPMTIEFLLRIYLRTHDELVRQMITHTLDKMARGGMYDQIGGGFHRYSTDATWLVPHFEKMLYDNAQLARVYLHAWQVTQDDFYRAIVEQTLDYVAREMTHAAGGFFSSQDADSEGSEGKYYVWRIDELRAVLGDDAALVIDRYGVTERGNFEGANILSIARDIDVVAALHNLTVDETTVRLELARQKLFAARERRVKPGCDDKVLTAWNGLMLATFAEAARVFHRDDYRAIAERNADFILRELRRNDGRLYRAWKDGRANLNAYLEDYADLIEGLLTLYETTFDPRWFVAARELADTMLAHFVDPRGGLYDTSDDHETLLTRPKRLDDNAVPSGNAMATTVLLKLAAFTSSPRYFDFASRTCRTVQRALTAAPLGFVQWLCALDFLLSEPKEIAIIGDATNARELLRVVFNGYHPHHVVALGAKDSPVPLLQNRAMLDGKATAYVCRNFACQLPVTEPEALWKQL